MHKYKIKADISGEPMCYFLCCCKGEDDDEKDNEINLFKLDEKSLEQLEKTEIEYTGRVQNDFIWFIPLRNETRNRSADRGPQCPGISSRPRSPDFHISANRRCTNYLEP